MNEPHAPAPATPAPPRSGLLPWLIFGPPALMVGLRWVLSLSAPREPEGLVLSLRPFLAPASLLDLLWPWLAGGAVLAAAAALVAWLGWRRVRGVAAGLWVLLWLAGCASQLQRHLDARTLTALPGETATVLAARAKAPSLRSTGGTELVLQRPGAGEPQALLTDEARATALKPGDRISLSLARGRFGGLYVTGWQAVAAVPPTR